MSQQRPLYPHGRMSSPAKAPDHSEAGAVSGRTDHDLVMRLRQIRDDGQEAMTALEEYEPNLCLELSTCQDRAAATALLETWLSRRTQALHRVQAALSHEWDRAHDNVVASVASRVD